MGVVEAHVFLSEQKVMRRHLAGNAKPAAPSLANGGQSSGGGGVSNMQMSARLAQFSNQADVTLHHAGLSFRRHTAQTQFERHRPQVHARALREARVLGVLDNAETHARRSGQNLAHHAVFQDRSTIVGDSHSAR